MRNSAPRSQRIVLLLESARGFDRGLLKGISRYSALHGRWTFYHRPPEYVSARRTANLAEFQRWKPDGIICSVTQAASLSPLKLPMVCFDPGNYQGSLPCVVTEDQEIGKLAARHLLETGHRHFAFCGFSEFQWSSMRGESFRKTIEDAGFTVQGFKELRPKIPWSREEKLIRKWLEELPKPVGLFCANDDRAVSISELGQAAGFHIPDDISIIGADNDELICGMTNPPFSSVRIASEQAGYDAAALLSRLISGEEKAEGQRITAKASGVAVRQSTDILMVQHPALRKAVQCIREQISQSMQVTDIVRASGLSHRALNELFQRELGSSIGKYLTRARIEHISYLLLNSSLQIQEVADAVGYEDVQHFSRYFKHSTGLTPLAYRRKMLTP